MSAAYVLTKDVKHLATWTQDREQFGGWARGDYRPICGGKVRNPMETFFIPSGYQYEDSKFVARAERLPVCRLCAKVLVALNEAAGGAR